MKLLAFKATGGNTGEYPDVVYPELPAVWKWYDYGGKLVPRRKLRENPQGAYHVVVIKRGDGYVVCFDAQIGIYYAPYASKLYPGTSALCAVLFDSTEAAIVAVELTGECDG